MKHPPSSSLRLRSARLLALIPSLFAPSLLFRSLVLLAACGPLVGSRAAAQDDFPVKVRASVERHYQGFHKEALHEHGKQYAIISLDEVKDGNPLSKPVNERRLFAEVKIALANHGFREPPAGTNPDIVLTLLYGRNYLRNPYADTSTEVAGAGSMTFGAPVVVASSDQMLRERQTPNYESKRQDADTEKLFISVTAWKYPSSPKEKPEKLWLTTILVDDPGMDLNRVAARMLAGGAAYFDHQLDKEEITVPSDNAHVNVGTPTVVPPNKTGK